MVKAIGQRTPSFLSPQHPQVAAEFGNRGIRLSNHSFIQQRMCGAQLFWVRP